MEEPQQQHTHSQYIIKKLFHTFTPTHWAVTLDEHTRLQDHLFSNTLPKPKHHVEVLSPKLPILQNTVAVFPHIPPPLLLLCPVPPSLCNPATILSCSRSHRSLALAQVLNRGTTWQTRTAVCLEVIFQAFVHRMIKKEPGVHLHSVQVEISMKVYWTTITVATQITPDMSQAVKMKRIVQGQTDRQICETNKHIGMWCIRKMMSDIDCLWGRLSVIQSQNNNKTIIDNRADTVQTYNLDRD